MASSIHTPLQGDDHGFRLLVLEPHIDRLAPLRCELNRASFDDKGLKYTALSYTWGDPLATTPILVNGLETQVTLNLEAALRHIRQPSASVILWVDALCINQEDLAEKNHQVEMMREIFSGAELVIAWLGIAGEDSDLAMGVFEKGLKALMELEGARYESDEGEGPSFPGSWVINNEQDVDLCSEWQEEDITIPSPQKLAAVSPQLPSPATLANYGDTGALPDIIDKNRDEHNITVLPSISISRTSSSYDSASTQDDRLFHALMDSKDFWELMQEHRMAIKKLTTREIIAMRKLLRRSWWCRVWVVQEVLLAKKVVFKCGDVDVSGEKMRSWRSDILLILNALCAAHDSAGHIFPAITLLEDLRNPGIESRDAMEYLFWYDMREATRPHDHIYGLLGIIPASHRNLLGAPDYSCKVEDLFIKVATKLMVDDNSLELLRAAGLSATIRETPPKRMSLPSWVPDWTMQCFNINPQDMFEVKGPSPEPVFSFSEDLTNLTVTGYKFDEVESMQSIPALGQGKIPLWQDVLTIDECRRDDPGPPPLQALVYALLSWHTFHEERDWLYMFAAFLQELQEYRISVSRDEGRSGHEDFDYLAGFLHWTGETRDGRTDEEILQKVFSAEAARSFSTWYHRQSSADLQCGYLIYSLWRDGFQGNAGFLMFRTSKGSFGITRAAVATGDIICVVPGCLAPLVLRKATCKFSRYLLLGPIQALPGLTSDGLTQAVKKGEITRETFTLV